MTQAIKPDLDYRQDAAIKNLFRGVVKLVGIVCTVVYNTTMKMIYTTDIFDQWLIKLRDKIAVAKIRSRMDRLEMGNAGDVKPVGEGVSEMRIHTGAGYRVYFIERQLEIVVLLCGGDKSSQRKDIERAKALAKDI